MKRVRTYKLFRETKSKVLNIGASLVLLTTSMGAALPVFLSQPAAALGNVVVTGNSSSWGTYDTRVGGNVSFVGDSGAPAGVGALQLTTDNTTAAKAQLLTTTNTKLAEVTALSYYTKQVSTSSPSGDPSYQLSVDLDGNGTPDTNLVYEPYWNGTPTAGSWQSWDVLSGKFWSSQTADGLTAGAGGPPLYTISDVLSANPDAVVLGFGTNVGTYNPSYTVRVDALNFNGTTYDFEPTAPAAPTGLAFTNPDVVCDGFTNVGTTTTTWGAVSNATNYNYRSWTTAAGSAYNSEATAYTVSGLTSTSLNGSFNQGEGKYFFEVQAVDANGLSSSWSNSCGITYDTTAPVVTVTPAAGSLLSGTVTFDITVTDQNLKSPNTVWVYLYNTAAPQKSHGANVDLSSGHGTFTVDTTLLNDGNTNLDVGKLYDAAGNASGTGDTYFKNYTIDNTAPSVPTGLTLYDGSNHQITTGYTNSYDVTAKWGAVSDATHYMYKYWNNIPGSAYNGAANASAWSVPTNQNAGVFNQGEGTHYIAVSACDVSNNCSAYSSPLSVVYDATAPVVQITAPAAGSTLHGTVTVSGTVNDVNPDHYYFVVKDHDGNVVAGPGTVNQATVSDWNWNTKNVNDGTYTIDLEARDKADNKNANSVQTINVTVDNSAPANLNNLSPSNGTVTNTAGLTHVDWTDANDATGPVSYYYEVSHSPATNSDGSFVTTAYQSGALSDSQIPTPGTPAGVYYWHVRAVDSLGNSTPWTAYWTYTIDNTAPTVTVDTQSTTDTTPTVTGTVDDSNAAVVVTVNGHTYTATVTGNTWSADVTDALSVGTYDVSAAATDTAGNVGHDATSNELTVTAPPAAPSGNNTNVSRQIATTGNATNTGNTNGGNATTGDATNTDGTVLGASTDNTGKVKGDSTVNVANASTKKSSNFAGLGWWWLAVIAALGLLWLLLAKRRNHDDA